MSGNFLKTGLVVLSLLTTVVVPAFAGPKVAMITSESGLGDKSFNDMMVEGMERAKTELGADYVVIQPRAISEFQSALARAAGQGFDIIIGSSFDMIEPMKTVAAAFPDQKFGLVDVGPEPLGPNVVSTVTKDWEGSFLVGYIAAKTTKTGTIGFVGGKDIPIIHRFFIGYYYGAQMANPAVKVIETYTGSFTDPAGGKEFTLSNINQGADINFAVAGPTSVGVIEAAKSTGTFAIGVDSNQNYL
ncbi:MAG: ABC-type transport system substrate-binding protein, partial [Devosia sp.]|nr:ABC-type transport system substrate-binding protein [Devosia sp.]